jgi:hypothetical protein
MIAAWTPGFVAPSRKVPEKKRCAGTAAFFRFRGACVPGVFFAATLLLLALINLDDIGRR